MNLATRYVRSIRWNVGTGIIQTAVLILRSVLLARLLPPETFGTYAFAVAAVGITTLFAEFGLAEAFLHRAPETEDEEAAAAGYFTLRLLLTTILMGAFLLVALPLSTGDLRLAFIFVWAGYYLLMVSSAAVLILTRRVVHRRLALRQLTSAILTTAASVYLAWRGAGIWALLVTDIINGLTLVVLLLLWKPVWKPRLAWIPAQIRYYWDFGKRAVLGGVLLRAMDEIDDLWTGLFLGQNALGLYSRAYQFAIYPRQVLATPLNSIADGTYAALKGDRRRLSEAFFRTNALLVRTSFPLAGLLALIATEFVPLVLGEVWVPMIPTFRLMLLFTMLDPLRSTLASVFIAVGRPEIITRVRLVQFGVLAIGLAVCGTLWNIQGVAIAVNIMLVLGIILLLIRARAEVDYSVVRLFAVPGVALAVALAAAYFGTDWQQMDTLWQAAMVKSGVFSLVFVVILLVLEGRDIVEMARAIRRYS